MRRWIHSAAAILTAFLALLLFAGAVRSGALTEQSGQDPSRAKIELARPTVGGRAGSSRILSALEYSRTRIVTITVGATPAPGYPGLNSHWQIDLFNQDIIPPGKIQLPTDAYDISYTLVNGEASIDYAQSAILITNSQGLYYEYRTNHQAQRLGNQILISQSYSHNGTLHYIATLNFTDPYRYIGYTGYAPTPLNTTQLQWDESFTGPLPPTNRYQFDAAISLVDPAARPRPELQIIADPPPALHRRLNQIYVSARIYNNGLMTTGAPVYVNLYDRIAPSVPPTGPLDLDGGWCSLTPIAQCGGASNPLPAIPPQQAMTFTAVYDLKPITGQHDIYLFVDALGIVNALGPITGNLGLTYESAEGNNSIKVGSLVWQDFVFLPLIRRN